MKRWPIGVVRDATGEGVDACVGLHHLGNGTVCGFSFSLEGLGTEVDSGCF